jgi:hypothetical protein
MNLIQRLMRKLMGIGNPQPDPYAVAFTSQGSCSWFGGQQDQGVSPDEGLALWEPSEISKAGNMFLPTQPPGTTGLARRLNPESLYIAMRWNYAATSRRYLQGISVRVRAVKNGNVVYCRPADWGPNEDTGRIADLSPGAMADLEIETNDVVICWVPAPVNAGVIS